MAMVGSGRASSLSLSSSMEIEILKSAAIHGPEISSGLGRFGALSAGSHYRFTPDSANHTLRHTSGTWVDRHSFVQDNCATNFSGIMSCEY